MTTKSQLAYAHGILRAAQLATTTITTDFEGILPQEALDETNAATNAIQKAIVVLDKEWQKIDKTERNASE